MKKNKKIWIGFLAVISLLIILPFFIPVRSLLNQAEQMASQKLGVPVQIADGRLAFLPSPRVVVTDIQVGKQQDLKFSRVVVVPTLTSLFSATKVVEIKVTQLVVKKTALDFLAALSDKTDPANTVTAVNLHKVSIEKLQLDWPQLNLPTLSLVLNLSADNQLDSAQIKTLDGKLTADVKPEGKAHVVVMHVDQFTLPVGLPLLVDKAKLDMQLKTNALDISNIDIMMYGGKITGNTRLLWDKNWRMNGQLKIAQLSVQQPSRLVSQKVYLSGALNSQGNFSAAAKDAAGLADNLRADFKFSVNNGVLHGLDLVKVASVMTKQSSGGQTQFDAFSGLLHVTGQQYHLRDLNISSGLLVGTGQVKIKPNKALDGTAVVELKNSASLVNIPLDVSGTVSEPMVLPSKAALAGAVAGTAILGPGLGTSLGMKAGTAVEKFKGLFDGE